MLIQREYCEFSKFMSFNFTNSGVMKLQGDALNTSLWVVCLIGINAQKELSKLMDSIAIA